MSTKDFSSIQEHRVADFMNWRVVSGSGARNFYPGDVESSSWLGECKTHIAEQQKITFKKEFWSKICNEADSKFKRPVLIVDDGTQHLSDTWCMFRAGLIPEIRKVEFPFKVKTNVIVDKYKLRIAWSDAAVGGSESYAFLLNFHGEDVCIVNLNQFAYLFREV